MRLKRLAALLVAAALASPLMAATSFSLISGMGYMSDFAFGDLTSFPSSVRISQGASDMGWFDDVDTSLLMDMSFGVQQRKLVQDPATGSYLTADQLAQDAWQYGYSTFYSQVSYTFRNALFDNRRTEKKSLVVDASIDVRFEQAFDSFDNIRAGRSFLQNYPWKDGTLENYWTGGNEFAAIPDLRGGAYMLATGITLKAGWDDMYQEYNTIYREGLDADGTLTLAPWFLLNDMGRLFSSLDSLFDTAVDYYRIAGDATYAKVLYNREDWKRWNIFSIVLEDVAHMQFLMGGAVPKFADTISFPGIGYTNLPLVAQNQLKLYLYGPAFLTDNTIPYGYVFLNLGLATGVPNNSTDAPWETFAYAEIGLNAHLEVMGALHIFAEVSYVFSNITNYGCFFDWNVGAYFSL